MCGIAGILNTADGADPQLLRRMCERIVHRGPDQHGTHIDGPIGLGIQRLAIIDVAGGDQPIANEDGSVVVVMNGEIYNHQELRDRLRALGHSFRTGADTEVLVHLYEEHGDALVDHLRGMFAFALWDVPRRRLLLGRDRLGKKPLFYTRSAGRFAFASEVVSLLADPNLSRELSPEAIEAYLALQYVPDPLSAFAAVRKLPPAHVMVVDEHGVRTRRYWELDYSDRPDVAGEEQLVEELREQLHEAVRLRLMSEVPLGAFLSGGIDSSAVVASMAAQMGEPVKTFCIGFPDPQWDESPHARVVAEHFGTDHHEFRVEPSALSIMPKLARQYGEPFADPSAIPSLYLAELAGRHVTVALNGDGGDENFGGYGRYQRGARLAQLRRIPAPIRSGALLASQELSRRMPGRRRPGAAVRIAEALAGDGATGYAQSLTALAPRTRASILSPDFRAGLGPYAAESVLAEAWQASKAPSVLEQMLDVDVRTYLPGDLLVKMDIATMAYSVETRSPFLDHRFMEWSAALPADVKLREGAGKHILKRALRGWVPDQVLDRPKMGFGVPLHRWFRVELRDLPGELLLDPGARTREYLVTEGVERVIAEHLAGRADRSTELWTLMQLEMWHREVVEAPASAFAAR